MTYGNASMEYSALTRELRDILSSEDRVWRDESEEHRGYHIERTAIPLGNGYELSVIWGWVSHHGLLTGINHGYPEALEAYVPGLKLDPVAVKPLDVRDIMDSWPDYRRLMP